MISRYKALFLFLTLLCVVLFAVDIFLGSVNLPFSEVLNTLQGRGSGTVRYIVIEHRLPKALTALLAGIGLSLSGLLMQTLFRNPMAGPYVLGITSGASLGVGLLLMGGAAIPMLGAISESPLSIIIASWLGSGLVMLAILSVASRLKDILAILIVGLMVGSFASAMISVLSIYSSAEQLQKFTFWSMGNLSNLSWDALTWLSLAMLPGFLLAVYCIKPLDALLLGENYAVSTGVRIQHVRLLIITATAILAGSITAFAGPIAFIGLASPHIARLIFKSGSHRIIFGATMLAGIALMLLCDILSQTGGVLLPINAVTSAVGAPIVIWLILRKQGL